MANGEWRMAEDGLPITHYPLPEAVSTPMNADISFLSKWR
jgi:hypothetical protein